MTIDLNVFSNDPEGDSGGPDVPRSSRRWSNRKRSVVALSVVIGVAIVYVGLAGIQAWLAWRSIERVEFDLDASRAALVTITTPTTVVESEGQAVAPPTTQAPPPPLQRAEYEAFLVIGSDERPEGHPQEGIFADAVMLYLAPADGDPIMVSLPRDLLVTDPCTLSLVKLNSLLAGCEGAATGPELISIAVEDFTGIAIDHFGVIGFDGLVRAVDELGGVELCTEHALRQGGADLLPEGCSRVDGATTLRYIRSRTTQELIDGDWEFQKDVSDLTRAGRQQEVLLAMLRQAKGVKTPDALADLISGLADAIILDEGLSMGQALDLAWDLRGTPTNRIRRLTLPVEAAVTDDGEFGFKATMPFLEVIEQG